MVSKFRLIRIAQNIIFVNLYDFTLKMTDNFQSAYIVLK